MAVEAARGCGFRKVGGLYLVGGGLGQVCDRLPVAIVPCDVCGAEPRFTRGIAKIDPARLWGEHVPCADLQAFGADAVCQPGPVGFLMWVGSEYTAGGFIQEAVRLGVSKRIPAIPKDLVIGEHWVYLARLKAVNGTAQSFLPGVPPEDRDLGPGVFYAFKPRAIEKIVTEKTPEAELEELRRMGITPIVVPSNDPDHNPSARGRRTKLPAAVA